MSRQTDFINKNESTHIYTLMNTHTYCFVKEKVYENLHTKDNGQKSIDVVRRKPWEALSLVT